MSFTCECVELSCTSLLVKRTWEDKDCMNSFSLMNGAFVKCVLQQPIWKLVGKEYGKTVDNYFSCGKQV